MAVIGAGLGRTGTLSLKTALEMLGVGPCYHMMEILFSPHRDERIGKWNTIAAGGMPDWDEVFDGYRSTVDWPACNYYRELLAAYPAAKVVLSRRHDADAWFDSTQATIFRQHGNSPPFIGEMISRIIGPDWHDRAAVTAAYERHNAEVVATVPADRLLVYTAGDGWEPLCAFLGVAVPASAYPHTNTTQDFQAMTGARP